MYFLTKKWACPIWTRPRLFTEHGVKCLGVSCQCDGSGVFHIFVIAIAPANGNGGDLVLVGTENIKNGSYPIINELYAVTRKGEENPNVRAFVDWMLTEEGQAIVEGSGYVGVK